MVLFCPLQNNVNQRYTLVFRSTTPVLSPQLMHPVVIVRRFKRCFTHLRHPNKTPPSTQEPLFSVTPPPHIITMLICGPWRWPVYPCAALFNRLCFFHCSEVNLDLRTMWSCHWWVGCGDDPRWPDPWFSWGSVAEEQPSYSYCCQCSLIIGLYCVV